MSRTLLTGASGFIGRQALAVLAGSGREIHAVAQGAGLPVPGVTWHEVDLLDRDAAARLMGRIRPESLLHLAWGVPHGRFWTAPENRDWMTASIELVRVFVTCGGRRAVLAGTCAEYDWESLPVALSEGDSLPLCQEDRTPVHPRTLYGACKHEVHMEARAIAEPAAVELAWGRIFFVYGPNEQPERLVPSIARSLLRGETVATTDGAQIRDFMHVSDVAGAFCALLASDVTGAVNIASGEAVSVRRIIELVAARAGGDHLVRWGELGRRPAEPAVIVADIRRLREEVGYTPTMGLEKGIESTVAWWRERI